MPIVCHLRSVGPWWIGGQFDGCSHRSKSHNVPLDRDLLDAVRDLDEHDLRRLLILARAQLERDGAIGPEDRARVRLRRQLIRCGKTSCTACPHGPYWYAYWWDNGRRRSRYVGRLLDED